jgi:succinate dehydrogenase / fumarate reductase iron-sulfur subunit
MPANLRTVPTIKELTTNNQSMQLKLKIWRQKNPATKGVFETYHVEANPTMSFLEMLDVLNEQLILDGKDPVAFDHDCREGICGACSMVIDGRPHGPMTGTTTCQLHMRYYKEGDTITIEPFRARAFPVVKDLVVDRSAFDRIIQAGGFVSVNTGQAADGNDISIEKDVAATAFDAAACIGCGACVAACPNASAMLFTGAKITHLAGLPQGQIERQRRVKGMVEQMDEEGFGACSNTYACSAECPKEIPVSVISKLNKEYFLAMGPI